MTRTSGLVCAAALATTLGGGFSSAYAKPKSEPPMRCTQDVLCPAIRRIYSSVLVKAGEVRAAVNAGSGESVSVSVGIGVSADGKGTVRSILANKTGGSMRKDVKSIVNATLDGIAFPVGKACTDSVTVTIPSD